MSDPAERNDTLYSALHNVFLRRHRLGTMFLDLKAPSSVKQL